MPVKKTSEKKASVKKTSEKKVSVKKVSDKKVSEKKTPVKKASEKKVSDKKVSGKKTSVKKASEKKKSEFKECPYCWNEIREKAVKCQYCGEFLETSEEVSAKKASTKGKELQIQNLPDKWSLLNERQKEVLIKNFPLTWWYKVVVFFFPWIFLLYARRYRLYILLLITSFIPGLNVIVGLVARILICVNWESLCYSKSAINMKRTLLQYRKQWDKDDSDYDDSEIYGHVSWWWIALLLIPICIVIFGILVAALMPRMQWAQWRARDVSRKTSLSQIQSAIVTSQYDTWRWPWMDGAKNGIPVSNISSELMSAGMSSVPKDPISTSTVSWLWNAISDWEYIYMVSKRNGLDNWWFVLMARTEMPSWSNWVVCDNGEWKINPWTDLSNITPCNTVWEWEYCSNSNWHCTYSSSSELRYILVY